MSIITWNCQGASDKKFPSIFKYFVASYKPDIFVIVEPKISGNKADKVVWPGQNAKFLFTTIYGNSQQQYKKFLWQDLDQLAANLSSSWLLAGDFNAILNQDERRGGLERIAQGCGLFKKFIHKNGLIDMGSHGPSILSPNATVVTW
ncbi:hypothetical protein K1719_013770 [Acacia pycnantha]|nr:hypothetical protein K1719_013770 [Acacia pycnantha]